MLIKRPSIKNDIQAAPTRSRVATLIGPHQSGKTTKLTSPPINITIHIIIHIKEVQS
ncbi:MAG: hypothetical protein U9Q82_01235 [Chloroflexota bacterium]|nr:hypothetical protein [Chloroflexota bacterium]